MKIANVVLNPFTRDNRVLKMARTLQEAGHDVTVFALSGPGLPERETRPEGWKVQRIPIGSDRLPRSPIFGAIKFSELIVRVVRMTRSAEIMHCNDVEAYVIGLFAKAINRELRLVYDCHEYEAERIGKPEWQKTIIRWIERRLLKDAAHSVSLTEAAVDKLLCSYPEIQRHNFTVITTCVDISRFSVSERLKKSCHLPDKPVVGTMGTLLSGWFYLDAFFSFFRVIKTMRPGARAFIVTRDDHLSVREIAQVAGVDINDVDVIASDPSDIPENLARMDMAVMFYAPDTGRAPTRLAEFLAAGVPVVGNEGVGDLARIIRESGVGSVVKDAYSKNELEHVAEEFIEAYPSITGEGNCRRAAESFFSADQGASQYRTIYRTISDSQTVAQP